MREVIFKNSISKAARKREICIEETTRENGCVSRTVKKSLYFVRNSQPIHSQEEFDQWMEKKEKAGVDRKRNFHIMKIHSDPKDTDRVICKAKGTFYVVVGKEIFNIVFLHSVTLEVAGPNSEKAG